MESGLEKQVWFHRTSSECLFDGFKCEGIPVFFDSDGYVEPLTQYMIEVVVREGVSLSSAETYAFKLQQFWKFIKRQSGPNGKSLSWIDVNDGDLIRYRDEILRGSGRKRVKEASAKSNLNKIFDFYVWAERTGRIKKVVAIYSDSVDWTFQISAELIHLRKGKFQKWAWPYARRLKVYPAMRGTPSPQQMEVLHQKIYEKSTCPDRDSLMAEIIEHTGLRSFELLQLKTASIPSAGAIYDAKERNEPLFIKILGKGGKERSVPALPELMERARYYANGERKEIIRARKTKNPAFVDEGFLFLSKKTGKCIKRQSLSHRMKALMRAADMPALSGHRIRARALTNIVEAEDGVDEYGRPLPAEQVLLRAAAQAGQSSLMSLAPYLNNSRKSRFRSGADAVLQKEARIRLLDQEINRKTAELAAMSAVKRGR